MKNIISAIRSLPRKGQHNIMKITTLAIGLALGLILIAKVAFEQSYDGFYEDSDRIYLVMETFPDQTDNTKTEIYPQTPGGVPVYLRMMSPEIETSTRFTALGEGSTFTLTESREKLKATYAAADSCFFDILSVDVLQGDPKEILSSPLQAMVSESVAENIGGDVTGKTIVLDGREDAVLTICGVFRDFPENSIFSHLEMLVSMPSISYYTWDGSMNLLGNDRYTSLIKIRDGADIADVQVQTDKFIEDNFAETLEKSGLDVGITFRRLDSWHSSNTQTRNMTLMLSLIAFALLFTAAMNYILLTVSSIIGRSKEMAVCKCYGADKKDIRGMLVTEAGVHTFLAFAAGMVLLAVFSGTVEKLTGTSLAGLLSGGRIFILMAVCIVLAVVSGAIPGNIFARIPVSSALRSYRESKRRWKLALLSVQFAAAAFLSILLLVISGQYRLVTSADTGYEYDNLAYTSLEPIGDSAQRGLILQELAKLPEVEAVTFADALPMNGSSGDNVMLPGDSRELFNCADLYYVGDGYFDLMEIPVIQGRVFNRNAGQDQEIMVSRRFVGFMEKTAGWDSDIVGKDVYITSYDRPMTICGVYEDFSIGSALNPDLRPSVIAYRQTPTKGFALIKFHRISPEAIARAEQVISGIAPDKEMYVWSYRNDMKGLYAGTLNFRNAVTVGGIVTLLIVFIGLVGYTSDEVNRRRKEIAVRKINGAVMRDIARMMNTDVVRIALPSVAAGAVAAFFTGAGWLEQFAIKTPMGWYMFIGGALTVLVLSIAVASYNVLRIAGENPVKSLRSE